MAQLFLAGCHIPVGWHNWTAEDKISQIGAVLDPAHIFFSLVKKYKGIWKLIKVKISSMYF
jgi:hypothetical protein